MSAAIRELVGPRPITVDQYHRLMKAGMLVEGAPIELIEGALVYKDRSARGEDRIRVSNEHCWASQELIGIRPGRGSAWHFRLNCPIVLPPISEPEPDGSVVLGSADDYKNGHPRAKDTLCAIEIADSSLEYDRTTKLALYARAGIPLYAIINIPDKCIEVYTQPLKSKGTYAHSKILTGTQRLNVPIPGSKPLSIPAKRLIP
jgi:Uma2 family endonuclease